MCKSFEASVLSHYVHRNGIGKSEAQDGTDYKLEVEISECMLVNIEFLILIWNLECSLRISNFYFIF